MTLTCSTTASREADVGIGEKARLTTPPPGVLGANIEALRVFAMRAPVGIMVVDRFGQLRYANERLLELTGLVPEEAHGFAWLRATHPADRHAVLTAARRLVAGDDRLALTCRLRPVEGTTRWVRAEGAATRDGAGRVTGHAVWVSDVTAERAARAEAEQLSLVLERSSDFVTIIDLSGRLLYANETVRRFFDVETGEDLRGRPLDFAFTEASNRRLVEEAHPALRRDGYWTGELVLVAPDGTEVTVLQSSRVHLGADGASAFVSGIGRDITSLKEAQSQLAASEARFRELALHDPLTGLPNRRQLVEQLRRMNRRRRRGDSTTAVLFVDLDGFKEFNDSRGHEAGDRLLAAIAARLRENLRPGDLVARLAGDEFVVVCEAIDRYAASRVGERILELVRCPLRIDDDQVVVTASVGIAIVEDGDAADWIGRADAAMYAAKGQGRGCIAFFEDGQDGYPAEPAAEAFGCSARAIGPRGAR